MEKREPLCAAAENVNLCSHYGNSMQLLRNLKIEVPDGENLSLDLISRENI